MADPHALAGRQILVIEDDYFLADDLERGLRGAGAEVIGPFSQTDDAHEALRERASSLSAAVLDINVAGAMIYPFAAELRDASIPFIFATGYDARAVPAEFDDVPKLVKPVEQQRLLDVLARIAR